MKNNKKHITKLFYKFLVDNGVLFQVLALINETNHKTLENHCEKSRVTRYVHNLRYRTVYYEEDSKLKKLDKKWREDIVNYLNNKK